MSPIIFSGKCKKFLLEIFFSRKSFSQEAEDLVAGKLLSNIKKGFYVDVGCHDPRRFSNTYFFYLRGWSGLCIDPLPGTKKKFNVIRPRDQVLEVGVSSNSGKLTYFMFNEPALNTFDKALASERSGGKYWIQKTIEVDTKSMDDLLSQSKTPKNFELLTIDVEGYDLTVLQSMNWMLYHPKVVIVESYLGGDCGIDLDEFKEDSIVKFVISKGYKFYAKTGNSVIFISNYLFNRDISNSI